MPLESSVSPRDALRGWKSGGRPPKPAMLGAASPHRSLALGACHGGPALLPEHSAAIGRAESHVGIPPDARRTDPPRPPCQRGDRPANPPCPAVSARMAWISPGRPPFSGGNPVRDRAGTGDRHSRRCCAAVRDHTFRGSAAARPSCSTPHAVRDRALIADRTQQEMKLAVADLTHCLHIGHKWYLLWIPWVKSYDQIKYPCAVGGTAGRVPAGLLRARPVLQP